MSDGTGASGARGRSPGRRRGRKSFLLFSPVQLSPARGEEAGRGRFFDSPQMQKVPKETGLKDDGNTERRRKRREREAS